MTKINVLICFLTSFLCHGNSLRITQSLTKLPVPLFDIASYYDGADTIYLACGWTGQPAVYSNAIYKYSIGSDIIQEVQQLPEPLEATSIVEGRNPGDIFILGGRRSGSFYTDKIFQLSTANLSLNIINPKLPSFGRSKLVPIPISEDIALVFGGFARTSQPPTSLREVLEIHRDSGEMDIIGTLNLMSNARTVGAALKNEGEVNIFYHVPASETTCYIIGATYNVEADAIIGPHTFLGITTALFEQQRPVTIVSDQDNHYIVGGTGSGGDGLPPGIYRVSKDLRSVVFHPVDGLAAGGSSSHYSGMAAVYMERLDRIYLFGGNNYRPYLTYDNISYIDLSELRELK